MCISARFAISVLLLGAAPLFAQRAGFNAGPRVGFPIAPRNSGFTISFHGNQNGSFRRFRVFPQNFYGSPFFYPDYAYDTSPTQTEPPQVILVQPAQAMPREPHDEKPAQMLLLERRGDRFIQIGESKPEHSLKSPDQDSMVPSRRSVSALKAPLPHPLPPAVLVFRDGRREEINGYAIANGTLYASSDYWQTGMWNRSIQLTSLNLPETLRQNEARGSKFVLPAGPNEVTVRP